jgi:signal transduction histidine kinase
VTHQSLRIRLILAYAGLIVVGFGGLALLAGQQISSAARQDYEQNLANEVILVARGLEQPVREYLSGSATESDLNETLAAYEEQTGAQVALYLIDTTHPMFGPNDRRTFRNGSGAWTLAEDLGGYPEFVGASRGAVVIDQRDDKNGCESVFTAAPITEGPLLLGYVQLSEPVSHLWQSVYRRWALLGLGVLGLTLLALLASAWLSTSLIRPLEKLRESALRLSQGDLSHRIADHRADEIGAVAQAFNEMADQVQTMIEEQRAFASNTSHELRTPLTTMRLRTEALRHEAALDDTTRQRYVVEIDEELIRLSGLVEDLIVLSRFDAGRAQLGTERVDLVRFAHSLHRTMAVPAAEKQITLALDIKPEPPVLVEASLNHLTILFRNLLDNAIKYTPSGGQVTWQIASNQTEALLTVKDTGQGIAPEHLPHLFKRFYRADRARSRSVQGTGLGLALAKSIVDAYGGHMEVTSAGPGRGTTVTVGWPLNPATA